MRVLISGIGRSGTTMMYQQIGRMMREAFQATRYRYEPYLWNLNVAYTREAAFGQGDLSASGMHAHQATPLFLSGEHAVHDQFLDQILGNEASLPGDPATPDSWLVKIIRGNGRLEPYLRKYPDLKVVICLRNPVDTLNSSMGMFSFTGEEFHRSDAPRLLAEVSERLPHIQLPGPGQATNLAVSAIWWRAFTEWAVSVAAAFPDRCYLFVHEQMAIDQDAEIERLARFLGFSTAETFKSDINGPAGRKTSNSHLLACDMADLAPHLSYYLDTCIRDQISAAKRQSFRVGLLQRYAERPFSPQVAGDALGQKTSLQLRDAVQTGGGRVTRYAPANSGDAVRISLRHRVQQLATGAGVSVGACKAYAPPSISRRGGFTFGCCITSFNSRETIRDTIYSALDQTMPFDRIVVVDDASTDGTQALLEEMAARYSRLTIHLKKHNGGVSAARDLGLRKLGTHFVTQIDSDDCFWPTKNREEAEVCFDDPSAIAFSPTMHDFTEKRWDIVNSSRYVGASAAVYDLLLEREDGIPRDMTMSLQTYLRAGGYDFRLSLFEDWDLKLRLAQGASPWKLSASRVGTVYNRRRNGLSNCGDMGITRGLTHVFLKASLRHSSAHSLAPRYREAIKPQINDVSSAIATLLALCDRGQLRIAALAPIVGRSFANMSMEDYEQHVSGLVRLLADVENPVTPAITASSLVSAAT